MRGGYLAALILAVASLVAMFAAAFVLFIVGAAEGIGDSDEYGRVPIPGQGMLRLPEGEVSVYYEEHSHRKNPRPPSGLRYSLVPVGGGPELDKRGSGLFNETVTSGGTSRVRYGRIDVPRDGTYAVSAEADAGDRPEPALTFGESFTSSALDRVKWAGLAAIGLVLAFLLAVGTFIYRHAAPDDERVTMPPDDE